MQHGILNALRQTQAQDNSLETLSQLPQVEIMRMAQNGQIDKTMLLPIMSKKAEMADSAAKLNAAQKGGGQQQASILEKKMAQIAQAENPVNTMRAGMQQAPQMQPQMQAQAPMTPENTGVAQLPIPERTYAGGGIVAFDNNKDQPVRYNMPSRDDETGERIPYTPSQGVPEYISDVPEYLGAKLGPFFSGIREQVNTGRVAPGATFNPSKQAPPTIATVPPPAQAKKEPGIVIHDDKGTKSKPGIANALQDADTQTQTQGPSELSQALALMRKDLEAGMAERKEARKDARNMRFAQAGLDIAGGTSPYFFTNLSQGSKALQGYGEDVKGLRAEDADTRKQLASLGLKGIELKQAEKELGAKLPLYGAQTKQALGMANYYGSGGARGAGLGGTVTPEVTRKLMEQYEALAINPKSDPVFFASLSPEVQQALKTPVNSPSYNRGLMEAKKAADTQMMRKLEFIGSLNRKSPAPALE
jgi:hypothetical protein